MPYTVSSAALIAPHDPSAGPLLFTTLTIWSHASSNFTAVRFELLERAMSSLPADVAAVLSDPDYQQGSDTVARGHTTRRAPGALTPPGGAETVAPGPGIEQSFVLELRNSSEPGFECEHADDQPQLGEGARLAASVADGACAPSAPSLAGSDSDRHSATWISLARADSGRL